MSKLVNLGYKVELYNPFNDDLHGVNKLSKDRLTLVVLNYPPASNQVTVRVSWCPKHALEIPRFVNEEDYIYVSFSNPYHLQDIPRNKIYINCYNFNKPTIDAFIDKLIGKEEFKGINPIDPYCGLFDTKF